MNSLLLNPLHRDNFVVRAGTLDGKFYYISAQADMLCTGHAYLRDRFARRSLILDLLILAASTWLMALAFVDPLLNISLTPAGLEPRLWGGLVAVVTFFLSVLQLKVDWKRRSDAHKRSLDIYAEVKREADYLLASSGELDEPACRRVLERYDMASSVGVEIPESEFLHQKQRHKIKVRLSKYLDRYPSAWIPLTRIRFWFRDNCAPRTSYDRKS